MNLSIEADKIGIVLRQLCHELLNLATSAKKSGVLVKKKSVRRRTEISDFSYEKGSSNYQASYPFVEIEEYGMVELVHFVIDAVEKNSKINDITSTISVHYGIANNEAKSIVHALAMTIATYDPDGKEEEYVADIMTQLSSDLNTAPIEWFHTVQVDGIWLDTDEIVLSRETKLRRPIASDLERELGMDYPDLQPGLTHSHLGNVVLEIRKRAVSGSEIQNDAELTVKILRLFGLGSVDIIAEKLYTRSFTRNGRSSFRAVHPTNMFSYKISTNLLADLEKFISLMGPIVSELSTHSMHTSSLWIAHQRYKEASSDQMDTERRITMAISCLESLLLLDNEHSELSHKLSQRVAILVGNFGYKSMEAYNHVKSSYNIRSRYIHGSLMEEATKHSSGDLCKKIVAFSRICLIAMLQLEKSIDKGKLISRIDKAMLDPAARTKLEVTLSGCFLPRHV